MIRTYAVGNRNIVSRLDSHTGPWIDLTPIGTIEANWRDTMTDPTNPDKVIIVGTSGSLINNSSIQISSDAGLTWTVPGGNWSGAALELHEVWYVDELIIWAVNFNGIVVRSLDGGLTFNVTASFVFKDTLKDIPFTAAIHALSADVAVVMGTLTSAGTSRDAYAWKTNDGGGSWEILNTLSTYLLPVPPELRNQEEYNISGLDLTNAGSGYDPSTTILNVATTTSGIGTGCILNLATDALGAITTIAITSGGTNYLIGDTLEPTGISGVGGLFTVIGVQEGNPVGKATGAWMSDDEQRIVLSSGYTQQLSIDGGQTFDSVLPEITRSGEHLTWFPSYGDPTRFRNVGGPVYNINESIDDGSSWATTRSGGDIILGAHFYSIQNGYYVINNEVFSTSNGGVTGIISHTDSSPSTVYQAVWTSQESPIVTPPTVMTLTPCCGGTVYQFGVSPEAQCTAFRITIDTDSPANTITYTDCDGILQTITYNAVIPPEHTQALVFDICVLDGTTVDLGLAAPSAMVEQGDCSVPTLPDWIDLDNLPDVIKWTIDGVTECYTLTFENVITLPTGLIPPPLSVDVEVLPYDDCDEATVDPDCLCEPPFPNTCYKLQDCAGIADSIFTRTDLSSVIGSVITLADENNNEIEGCWFVIEVGLDCPTDVIVSVYRCFEDCEDCLPTPLPPEVPCPRPVDPGYSTGMCDPQIVEDIYCSFAEMNYQRMMSKRFAIKFCCPPNEMDLVIKKEKIDMLLRTAEDPTPDPCDPICYAYEIYIDATDSAVTTYMDCFEVEQTIITDVDVDPLASPRLVGFCALDTSAPMTTITHPDTTTDTHLVPRQDECVPPVVN